jgi:hypothetical protein
MRRGCGESHSLKDSALGLNVLALLYRESLHGRTWEDLGGLGRTWEDLGGLGMQRGNGAEEVAGEQSKHRRRGLVESRETEGQRSILRASEGCARCMRTRDNKGWAKGGQGLSKEACNSQL